MNSQPPNPGISRRGFLRDCVLGASALASFPVLGFGRSMNGDAIQNGAASRTMRLDENWLFVGRFPLAPAPHVNRRIVPERISLPHSVTKLSWQKWDPATWEDTWLYRRYFDLPRDFEGLRVFLHFEGVMTGVRATINGHELPPHLGGYLPFQYEITRSLAATGNTLEVIVDSRWSQVPPEGSPRGPVSIDYLEPGGITRPVYLQAVPQVFIRDVFAKPANVLQSDRRIEVECSIDAASVPSKPVRLRVELRKGSQTVAHAEEPVQIDKPGQTAAALKLTNLGAVKLWDVNDPNFYEVVDTLLVDGKPLHDYRVRIGLREARFDVDGFFLNGRRFRLFGLNRHELFPYVGGAMPRRVMRRDAEILKHEFNCNIVRCSHYPQSPAFLDACDELGLMVWEEPPGWQYLGDEAWKDLAVRDVQDMVRRDRNRPSVVIWGVRVNESANDSALYQRTTAAAKALDDSRPTSGSMTPDSLKTWQQDWKQDVFAFDDYHAEPDGTVGIREPLPGVPYMLAEAVGQFAYAPGKKGFTNKYRRAGDLAMQMRQALLHAQAHSRAASFPRMAGVIAWCAFDYGSLINSYDAVKCPGVADGFRIPKLGAAFYLAQVSPKVRPIIQPNFYWDFGPTSPNGPGKHASIFSNCDRLEIFINGKHLATATPDRENFPNLEHPPFFSDLELDGAHCPELRIDGYIGNRLALSKSFSSDTTRDTLSLKADDHELSGDGSDGIRLVFQVTDKFGAPRAFGTGQVAFELTGPGLIIGDNPFNLEPSGGVGAVWIRSAPDSSGRIRVSATHSSLGKKSLEIKVRRAEAA